MWRIVTLALAASLGFAAPAVAAKTAFVVGIDRYPNLKPDFQLERPSADAEAVARTLAGIGFSVDLLTRSVTQEDLVRRFTTFVAKIEPGDTALLYFAGHGISLENNNYLLPSDIPALEPGQELLARTRALAETDLRAAMRERGARVVLMVIDACRDNPFPKRGTRSIGLGRGLAATERAEGVFSLYSASLGQQALDRLPGDDPDPNSVFTRIFVRELAKPGQNLIDLGENVRDAVASLAETVRLSQVPAYYNEVRGARAIFLAGAGQSAVAAAPTAPAAPAPRRPDPPVAAPAPGPTPPASSREAAIAPAWPAERPGAPTAAWPSREPAPSPAPAWQGAPSFSYPVGLDPAGDNWLALRSEPGGRGYRIMKMGPETLLTVIRRQGVWSQVRLTSGETGWAHSRYIGCCRPAVAR